MQGIGGGGLQALAWAIIADLVPPRERSRQIGKLTVVYAVCAVIGPLVGGLVVENTTWRWIFWANLPLCAVFIVKVGAARGLRFSKVVSVGNCVDVTPAEIVEHLVSDDETRVVGCYLEGARDGERLVRALRAARGRVPVVVMTGGLSEQGGAAAVSHTGALTGSAAPRKPCFRSGSVPSCTAMSASPCCTRPGPF